MLDFIRNLFSSKYANHPEAVVITCYYNPKNSQARLDAFNKFYETIKHLNHRIIECVVEGSSRQLTQVHDENIKVIHTSSNLWHKEQLLNKIVASLPAKYKYVLWVDADVLFTNKNWVVEAVEKLQYNNVVQLFEYCVHLEKGESAPTFDLNFIKQRVGIKYDNRRVWRSYAANFHDNNSNFYSEYYDIRGHVGFAWGARRNILEEVPLFEGALIGGADGIIACASTGQLTTTRNISDMFKEILPEVHAWGQKWDNVVRRKVGYVSGDLYHIWHGDIKDRQYYKRIKDFGPHLKHIASANERDSNGLYTTKNTHARNYVSSYYDRREPIQSNNGDDGFAASVALGYLTNNGIEGGLLGGNMVGGMVGDMLNTSENTSATSDYTPESHHSTTQPSEPDHASNENFS